MLLREGLRRGRDVAQRHARCSRYFDRALILRGVIVEEAACHMSASKVIKRYGFVTYRHAVRAARRERTAGWQEKQVRGLTFDRNETLALIRIDSRQR